MTANRPWRAAGIVLAALVAACNNNNNGLSNYVPPNPPTDLIYQLNLGEQVGSDSVIEPGVLLSWLPPSPDSTVEDFEIFGSDSTDSAGFVQRAITTSITFHDAGLPQVQYFVESQDVNGVSSAPSNIVLIDPSDTVQSPDSISFVALDSAAELGWPSNSITGPNGAHFDFYRLYSEAVTSGSCDNSTLVLEGQTVSQGFVLTGLANGVQRCYFVTAVTKTGHEDSGSPLVIITPSSSDPPYSAARIPGNYVVIAHHPIVLRRAHTTTRILATK